MIWVYTIHLIEKLPRIMKRLKKKTKKKEKELITFDPCHVDKLITL